MNTTILEQPHRSTTSAPTIKLVQPYLFFNGRCEEALDFYTNVLGAKVTTKMRFSECPDQGEGCSEGGAKVPGDKIMHAAFNVGNTELFASDGMSTGTPKFEGFGLSISVPDAATADHVFGALADGGKVEMPLAKTFFSPRFGMVTDRFDVTWMVIVPAV